MTTLAFLDLTVVSGPNTGMRYSIPEGMFRILGRYESGFIADNRPLNPEQQELLLKHLPKEIRDRAPDILLDDLVLNTTHGLILYFGGKKRWIDLLNEETKDLLTGDVISIGNTKLKVS